MRPPAPFYDPRARKVMEEVLLKKERERGVSELEEWGFVGGVGEEDEGGSLSSHIKAPLGSPTRAEPSRYLVA